MRVKFTTSDTRQPVGKLADAELLFDEGPLTGLRLIGFAVWERRGGGSHRSLTFPSRQYNVNGERRSFALLRPTTGSTDTETIREFILDAYAAFEAVEPQ